MASAHSFTAYHDYLRSIFEQRAQKNANYSLRAFARDLDLSPSRLSEILRGAPISVFSAKKVARHLGLSESENAYLLDLVRLAVSRSSAVRERAQERLEKQKTQTEFKKLEPYEHILEKWYNLAVAEYLTLTKPLSFEAIQKTLGLTASELKASIELLSARGFIRPLANGSWRRDEPFKKAESPSRSNVIRRFHQTYLQWAARAIETKAVTERKALTAVFSMSKSDFDEARAELERFTADFVKKYGQKQGGEAVYAVGVQLYELADLAGNAGNAPTDH